MKPPIGIIRKEIWEYQLKQQRLVDLYAALKRYLDVDMNIPPEWIAELHELTQYFLNHEIK